MKSIEIRTAKQIERDEFDRKIWAYYQRVKTDVDAKHWQICRGIAREFSVTPDQVRFSISRTEKRQSPNIV